MFTGNQIEVMLKIQDQLNTKTIGEHWVEQRKPFMLAAGMEAAEAIEHHGWKWWKLQCPDLDQVKMELIDILHFLLSDCIQEGWIEVLYKEEPVSIDLLSCLHYLAKECFADEDLDAVAYWLYASFNAAGVNADEAFAMYLGKNVLNTFRQNNGYKEGTYVKVWSGKEDNQYLTEIIRTLDMDDPEIDEKLYQALTAAYQTYA